MDLNGAPHLLQIHDFAQLSESIYYVYNDIERLRDEPHTVRVQCEEDIQVTEEVYRRPIFLLPSYRCFLSSSSSCVVGGFAFAS